MLSIKNTLISQSKIPIVPWSSGSDEEVAIMLEAARNGLINLSDYWKVGDTRTVQLAEVKQGGGVGGNTIISAQDIELVLVHSPSSSAYYGGGEFIVQQKDCLLDLNYMNSSDTNTGSFANSAMANFLNDGIKGYLRALPEWLVANLLTAQVITAKTYNGTELQISSHKVFLPAEKEIFGSRTYSNLTEFNALEQWDYYKTSANRIKKLGSSANFWWERSPYYSFSSSFCYVTSGGSAYNGDASIACGVAPCMLI